ncbi:hypothetical protein CQA53_10160 [Helicobacter didelphidarum]|uniref:Uncharacterized protein n=1 Tax=Helicobacter didelphidarum TaxID=2040648 RepID=A0A3D8I9I3_9HELI|nr:hypothetical protein [Helicobacter didelphidarum]RDU61414.1 hypothetical protein CQA53_10160 [Helicobacter didelphidarum]
MKDKFQWQKFILDCFLCFGVAIISPLVYSILVKSDNLRWLLYPIQWFMYPIQWLLYPIQWLFSIDIHTIGDIAEFIVGFFSLSLIVFFVINISYKIHKLSLSLSLIFMVCYTAFGYYFFSHL